MGYEREDNLDPKPFVGLGIKEIILLTLTMIGWHCLMYTRVRVQGDDPVDFVNRTFYWYFYLCGVITAVICSYKKMHAAIKNRKIPYYVRAIEALLKDFLLSGVTCALLAMSTLLIVYFVG